MELKVKLSEVPELDTQGDVKKEVNVTVWPLTEHTAATLTFVTSVKLHGVIGIQVAGNVICNLDVKSKL